MQGDALVVDGVSKTYGATPAVRSFSLTVQRGEVVGLVGHNGAGKSTIVKMISGAIDPDHGTVSVAGQVLRSSPGHALELGVRCVQQIPSLLPNLTVAENISILHHRGPLRRRRADRALCRERLALLDCDLDPDVLAGTLQPGNAQEVEIARELDDDMNVLVLDEPTASLSARESDRLKQVMATLAARGIAQIIVSHDLGYVLAVTDRIVVLRDGAVVESRSSAEWTQGALVAAMMGFSPELVSLSDPLVSDPTGPPAITARGIDSATIRGLNLAVHPGEIVGITGALGSGIDELARVLGGIEPPAAGELTLHGRPLTVRGPRQSLRDGLGYIPADRIRSGLFPNLTVVEQIGMATSHAATGPIVHRGREWADVQKSADQVGLPAHRLAMRPGALSGGNQQKVLVSRVIRTGPTVLVAHEPTVGVDVGARAAIHQRLRLMAADGVAIVVVSSDTEEITLVCDRAVVLRNGRVVFQGRADDERALVSATVGGSTESQFHQGVSTTPTTLGKGLT